MERNLILYSAASHIFDNSICNGQVYPPSNETFRKDHGLGGKGVFIAVQENYTATEVPELDSECEAVWNKFQIQNSKTLYLCSYYRPPDNDPAPDW